MFDFSIHAIPRADEAALFDLSGINLDHRFAAIETETGGRDFTGGLVSLYDATLFDRPDGADAVRAATGRGVLAFAWMPDIHDRDAIAGMERALHAGCCAIVFHPYLQDIGPSELDHVTRLCREAERIGLFVCVCAAYGGPRIYRLDPMHAADRAAQSTSAPVVIVHGGGRRVLDAMLVADTYPHVLLETSYSLSYWLGSSVETDFAFAMRKLGADRWLFGTDTPFMAADAVMRDHLTFFERHGFDDREIRQIMETNARRLTGDRT